jgi:hypothetical protein
MYTATSTTAGNRSAGMITLPSGLAATTTVSGVNLIGQFSAGGGSFKVGIWDSANSLITSRTVDGDHTIGLGTGRAGRFEFASPVTLTNGTKYYVGLEVVSANATGIYGVTFASSNDMRALPNGANSGIATYNGTSWTESNSTYPLLELITNDITQSAAGGGALLLGGLGQTGIGSF